MTVIGIDLGVRKAAVAIIDSFGDYISYATEIPREVPRHKALQLLGDFVAEKVIPFAAYREAASVYVEEPLVGRGVRVSLQIAQTAGAVLARLAKVGVESVYLVSNTDWKKDTVGKGNANKDLISKWLDELHPSYSRACDGDQDRVDATCIAIYGLQQSQLAARLREGIELSGA